MTVHEVVCSNCGAINRDAREPCWRCLGELQIPAAGATAGPAPELVSDRAD